MRSRLTYAMFGVLATLVGVAAGHLVASVLDPASSPVLTVGSQVIDLTPTPMKEWAIREFGNRDKDILIGSVLGGVLALAAVAGLLARRRFALGAGLQVVLVATAAATAMNRPAAEPRDLVPALATAIAGVGALWLLDRRATRSADDTQTAAPATSDSPREVGAVGAPTSGADVVEGGASSAQPIGRASLPATMRASGATALAGPSRRGVLVTAGFLAMAAAVMGGAGRWIGEYRTRLTDIAFPRPADPARAFPTGIEGEYPGITPLRIDNDDFYRVDTRLDVPIVDIENWTLTIDGMVEKKLEFTFEDLLQMPLIERDITLTCVSNSVGGPYVGGARWIGVRLTDLLEMAGVRAGVDQILSTDVDGMTIGTPYELATDGRDAMIALGMNGEALPREHGYPARMVVPGLYGFISACKWIERITLTTYAERDSYWTDRDWATVAPIKISSRIDTPKVLEEIKAGETFIGGIAWAQQNDGVAKVQVQVDGGPWRDAELGPSVNNDYWRQWYFPWTAEPGSHNIASRVIDGTGATQTDVRMEPFPEGSSGIQTLIVTVA